MGSSMGPTPADLPGMGASIAASLVSLGVVCLAAYLALRWLSRRTSRPNFGGPLRVLARHNLEPRRSVYVVEAAGRCFLVGAADNGMNLLAELDHETVLRDVAASRAPGRGLEARFAEVFSRVMTRRRKQPVPDAGTPTVATSLSTTSPATLAAEP